MWLAGTRGIRAVAGSGGQVGSESGSGPGCRVLESRFLSSPAAPLRSESLPTLRLCGPAEPSKSVAGPGRRYVPGSRVSSRGTRACSWGPFPSARQVSYGVSSAVTAASSGSATGRFTSTEAYRIELPLSYKSSTYKTLAMMWKVEVLFASPKSSCWNEQYNAFNVFALSEYFKHQLYPHPVSFYWKTLMLKVRYLYDPRMSGSRNSDGKAPLYRQSVSVLAFLFLSMG